MRLPIRRLPVAGTVVCAGLLLAGCGGSGAGLIPAADAGPLAHDFEEVAQAARSGNGSCTATTEAIERTERDFAKVSARIDISLRSKLQEGIVHLRAQALDECSHASTSTTTTTTKTHTAEAIVPVTTTSSTQTTQAPATTSAPTGEETPGGGGTPAPGGENSNPGGAEAEGGPPGENRGGGVGREGGGR